MTNSVVALIFSIEYAMKASVLSGNTSIAVRGAKTAAFVTQKKVPDRLVDPSSVTSIYRVTDGVGCVMLGLPGAVQVFCLCYFANAFITGNNLCQPMFARKWID